MCGIIGYTGPRSATPILLEGLTSLEYRGYDSAGIAVLSPNGDATVSKASGKLGNLKAKLNNGHSPEGTIGIGHTRWATHGDPTDFNAHPHADCSNDVVVVHNGIVENYIELKKQLIGQGHRFASQTDTECIPHLVESFLAEEMPLEQAVRATASRIRGANAIVVVSRRFPDRIVAVRLGNAGGIVVGYGNNEMVLASDIPAILPHTRDICYLAGGEMVSLTRTSAVYSTLDGASVHKEVSHVDYDAMAAVKGDYAHFMLKEIHEQPEAMMDTLRGRLSGDYSSVHLEELARFTDEELRSIERVVLLGMGTSLHAGMVGRNWLEMFARVPAESDNSSEFRYRDPVINERTLVVSISQSGETADTLAAMDEAVHKHCRQITLCNYAGTQTTRVADATILIRAGLEIGVAASKTFVCSLTALCLLALSLGIRRGTISGERVSELVSELVRVPQLMGRLLADQRQYREIAALYADRRDFLFLGRGLNFPLAMEGALKLKEISYIHAEGYPAGEMKHGPISLIDPSMPVVALMPQDHVHEKMLSNINEVKARGGIVIAIATEGDEAAATKADHTIYIPKVAEELTPLLTAIPMQLLAYHIAVLRGCDVDQPRNLAKSVTVE